MFATRFFRFVSLAVSCLMLSLDASFAADARRPVEVRPARKIDYWEPSEVKPLVEELLQAEARKPAEERIFYAEGVGHFDGFLPGSAHLLKDRPAKNHIRLTFHDGRIARCECLDAAGGMIGYEIIRNDRRGAPRLNGSFRPDGKANSYKYATYDPLGRVSAIYLFDEEFELRFFDEFHYRGKAVDIRRRDRDRVLQDETIYENGDVFLVTNDVKRKVNRGDRAVWICAPVKYGLKPLYPGYEEQAAK